MKRDLVISTLFFLSGATSLLYEVVWFKKLHLVFGVSIFAIGAVVTAFMLGLAIGSRWAASNRWIRKDPLIAYAWMEIGIALFALLFPMLLRFTEISYLFLFRFLTNNFLIQSIIRFLCSFIILLPATFMMGVTLPALSQVVADDPERRARKVGWLYGINTLGGVAGIILAGFYALEHLGVQGSIYLGIIGNLIIGIGALALSRHQSYTNWKQINEKKEKDTTIKAVEKTRTPLFTFAAIIVMVTGLISMTSEIIWTRSLVFYIHNSTYAFSSVLVIYLSGIAIGAMLGALLVRYSKNPLHLLIITLAMICMATLFSIIIYRNLPLVVKFLLGNSRVLPNTYSATPDNPLGIVENWLTALMVILAQVSVVLFFPTVLFGFIFPITLQLVRQSEDTTAGVVGRLYAANTIGCVVGTILGTFVLVTVFGTGMSLLLLAWFPVPLIIFSIGKDFAGIKRKIILLSIFFIVMIIGSIFSAPRNFYREMFEKRFGNVVWFSEGISETVAVCEPTTGVKWLTFSDGRGASGSVSYKGGWLYAHIPLLLHPNPNSALVICFGTGNTLGAASRHQLERLDCVELSSEVVKASHLFKETNHDVANNKNVNIIIEDGRNYLLATDKLYDVITEEPPLIHTSGVINLYTKEFYELCSRRMTENGIMAVWLATWELQETELKMLVKAFVEVFPHTSLWDCIHSNEWLLIGSKERLKINLDVLKQRMSEDKLAGDLKKIQDIESPANFLALYLKGHKFLIDFAGDVDPVVDDKTVVDYTTPRQARSNYGLGEGLTGGLFLVGVNDIGSVLRIKASINEKSIKDFNKVYVFRESVIPHITSYGSYDPIEFKEKLHRRVMNNETVCASLLLKEIMKLAKSLHYLGDTEKSLATLNQGLSMVPQKARASIYAALARIYLDNGDKVKATEMIQKALEINPQHQWANQLKTNII